MSEQDLIIEIDGERVDYTGYYSDPIWTTGAQVGMNETTKPGDDIRSFEGVGQVYGLSVYRDEPDGSTWGIDGLFRCGEWATDEDTGKLVYRVWDRLA